MQRYSGRLHLLEQVTKTSFVAEWLRAGFGGAAVAQHTAEVFAAWIDDDNSLELQLDCTLRKADQQSEHYYLVSFVAVDEFGVVAKVAAAAAAARLHSAVKEEQSLQIAALFALVCYIAFAFDRIHVLLVDNAAYHLEHESQRGPAHLLEGYARPL